MKVSGRPTDVGVELSVADERHSIEFPPEVWQGYPNKEFFTDNYTFLKAIHLPEMLGKDTLDVGNSYPLFKRDFSDAMMHNITFTADVDGASSAERLKDFLNIRLSFKDYDVKRPKVPAKFDGSSLLNMSFGKDSLLTYAVARELGIKVNMIMSVDNDCLVEHSYKLKIADQFSKDMGERIWLNKNNSGVIHRYKHWKVPRTEWGFGHLITEYCINAVPYMHHLRSGYLLFGNEKSCDDTYINSDGYKSYPVFDQSSEWLLHLTRIVSEMTMADAKVMSMIEPLHDLAITRILHKRYPQIGKYQMSCFPDENEHGKRHYWCGHCSKCARVFIFMKANGIDPNTVGLDTDMLRMESKDLFSLFSTESKEGKSVGYDASGCGRDEQLLAFLMAYKEGAKGELIELFKEQLLEEAMRREESLKGNFFMVHDSKTIPPSLLPQLRKIYSEALKGV